MLNSAIETFIKDELSALDKNKSRIAGIKHEDLDHYLGVIAGQVKAYDKVVSEIKRLRRLP